MDAGNALARYGYTPAGGPVSRLLLAVAARGFGFVVSRDDPDPAPVPKPDLKRAQDMAGRMQRDAYVANLDRFPAVQRRNLSVIPQPGLQNGEPWFRAQVMSASPARMVGVCMGNNSPIDGPPGINVKSSQRTVEALLSRPKKWFVRIHVDIAGAPKTLVARAWLNAPSASPETWPSWLQAGTLGTGETTKQISDLALIHAASRDGHGSLVEKWTGLGNRMPVDVQKGQGGR